MIYLYKAKGINDLLNSPAAIRENPCHPAYSVTGPDSYAMPRYTMHMVKDSSIT